MTGEKKKNKTKKRENKFAHKVKVSLFLSLFHESVNSNKSCCPALSTHTVHTPMKIDDNIYWATVHTV